LSCYSPSGETKAARKDYLVEHAVSANRSPYMAIYREISGLRSCSRVSAMAFLMEKQALSVRSP
jgi:hypothetical protein